MNSETEHNQKTPEVSSDRVLKFEEICKLYPKEWVLIADPKTNDNFDLIEGKLLAHSPDRDAIDEAMFEFNHVPCVAIEYTGPVPDDYAVMF